MTTLRRTDFPNSESQARSLQPQADGMGSPAQEDDFLETTESNGSQASPNEMIRSLQPVSAASSSTFWNSLRSQSAACSVLEEAFV
jgi:hypothetical protein